MRTSHGAVESRGAQGAFLLHGGAAGRVLYDCRLFLSLFPGQPDRCPPQRIMRRGIYPIPEKFVAFGFNTIEIDGNNFDEIETALENAKNCKGKPTAIVAKTVKGKGVSYMENQVNWHGAAPNEELYNTAVAELTAKLNELEAAK